MTRLRHLLAVALLAASAPAAAAPAAAAPPTAARTVTAFAPAGNATFGIQPAAAEKPDARPQFQFGATKGAIVRDQVAVRNHGDKALTLQVYASDAFNTPEGGFDLLPGGRTPVDVGAWTKLAAQSVTVPAKGVVIVPFTLTIPANVTPGDHVGGIVASMTTTQTDAQGNKVSVDQRVGTRIYLRVPGLLRATLSVDELTGAYRSTGAGGSAAITYTVRNTGNVRIGARQQLTLQAPLWHEFAVPSLQDLPELLPGSSLQMTVTSGDVPPAGLLTARLRLDPQAVATDLNPTMISVVRTADFWAATWVTWVAAAGGLLLLAGLILLIFVLLRRRRRGNGPAPRRTRATVSA